ncbi:MAG: zf-HC2 domain-containing protein [Deltaproteobacteria bacterium]|nr:zf-HC2 domain-containing protein [Deltaproteobacteria bacterium]MBF0525958.1 zf-HC2 domain-containing protein [Deltaproteobacteria bacterium]
MDCKHAIQNLSEYLDQTLDQADTAQVAQHLASCPACRGKYEALKGMTTELRNLPPVKAPAGFLDAVHTCLEQESRPQFRLIKQLLSFPRQVKFPPQLTAAAVLAGLILLLLPNILSIRRDTPGVPVFVTRLQEPAKQKVEDSTWQAITDTPPVVGPKVAAPAASTSPVKAKRQTESPQIDKLPTQSNKIVADNKTSAKKESVVIGRAESPPVSAEPDRISLHKSSAPALRKAAPSGQGKYPASSKQALMIRPEARPAPASPPLAQKKMDDGQVIELALAMKKGSGGRRGISDPTVGGVSSSLAPRRMAASKRVPETRPTNVHEKATGAGLGFPGEPGSGGSRPVDVTPQTGVGTGAVRSDSVFTQVKDIIEKVGGRVTASEYDQRSGSLCLINAYIPADKFQDICQDLTKIADLTCPHPTAGATLGHNLQVRIKLLPN